MRFKTIKSLLLSVFILIGCNVAKADGACSPDFDNSEQMFAVCVEEAEQGYAAAQLNLALMYYNGEGTTQNYKAAFDWFTKAAEQGYAKAQYNLAVVYYIGQGTVQDYIEAYAWVSVAAAQGGEGSVVWRDQILKIMTPSQIEKGQALAKEYFGKYVK